MDQQLRLFIAIDLPPDVKQVLRDAQSALKSRTDAVRWADPDGTHLTLKFLGAVEAGRVAAITEGMTRAVVNVPRFTLQTGELGVFPNAKRPRVVWIGVGGAVDVLRRLQMDVERFVAPLGFPTEQRPFSPHLTLGRSFKEPSSAQLASIGQAVEQASAPESLAFEVTELVLMRSELRPGGARYTPVAHVPLDAL